MRRFLLLIVLLLGSTLSAQADTVKLYAADSLQAAMSEVVREFELSEKDTHVEMTFGPSGLLRRRIEKTHGADLFASANMTHPRKLLRAGLATGSVQMFAHNDLCGIAKRGLSVTSANLLQRLLDEKVRVGISTPKADPSGDYAFELFRKAERLEVGSRRKLERKALQLVGKRMSVKAPKRRNQYGWLMTSRKADIFLTYCTNAVLAKLDTPQLQIVEVPKALSVGADYGLILLKGASPAATRLVGYLLSAKAQEIFKIYGFRSAD